MKHLKKFEVASERMYEPPEKHDPKHKYDRKWAKHLKSFQVFHS